MAIDPEPYGADSIITRHGGMITIAIHTFVNYDSPGYGYDLDAFKKMRKIADALDDIQFTFTPWDGAPSLPSMRIGPFSAAGATNRTCRPPTRISTSAPRCWTYAPPWVRPPRW